MIEGIIMEQNVRLKNVCKRNYIPRALCLKGLQL